MAAVFDISLRTAKTVNEKTPEALFGTGKIAPAIHRAEDLVVGDLLVECGDQPVESFIADGGVDFVFFHRFIVLQVSPEARRHAWDRGPGQSTSAR